jgi:DNA primase
VTVLDLYEHHFPMQPLRQSGRGWRGACPLCGERDPETRERPAFSVFADGHAWHCFRCLEGGDIFTLARWLYNDRSFPAVADAIASDFGIATPEVKQNEQDRETNMIPSRRLPRDSVGRNHSRESKRPGFEIRGGRVVPS